ADIQAVYLDGWRMGLKGVALYRDGSKFSQPLSSAKSSTSEGKETPLAWGTARQLPPKRTGFTQEARVAGQKVHLRTGE
ncbi:hypothetical protein ACI4AC_27765, partial [Klebsiella pneumoniae]|uniref:hypothetical protein n=1 Tax=Klebsiella pneumoniae TaxID=573 RepID=UPI0038541743